MKATEQLNISGIVLTLVVLFGLAFFIDIETVKGFIERAGMFAPLLFILMKASTVVIAPLSGAPLYPIVGAFFGFWPGYLYVVIGDFLGYSIAFWLARKFGYPLVTKFISSKETSLLARIVKHVGTPKGFFHMCLTCGALPELVSYGAGLSKLPYPIFIGILLPLASVASAVFVFFGSTLSAENSISMALIMPVVAMGIMAVGGWFFLKGIKEEPNEP
jgi:uncharacterized membrane protein YdjX (TVP38/TMEM64 family)